MRNFPLLLIFSIVASAAFAQGLDSMKHKSDSAATSISTKFDSISDRVHKNTDSIQLLMNGALKGDFGGTSIHNWISQRRFKADSLKTVRYLDSVKYNLQHKIDSLTALNLPAVDYRQKLDSVRQISPQYYFSQAQGKARGLQSNMNKPLDDLENKINQPVDDIEAKVDEKLAIMNKEGGAAANLPGTVNVGDFNLPGAELNANLDLRSGDFKVPGVGDVNPLGDVKERIGEIDNPLAGQMAQVGELKDKVTDAKNIPQQQVDRLKSIDEVQAVQGRAAQANELVDKAQAYQQDVSNIAKGDLGEVKEIPKAIENKVAGMAEMKELQEQTGELTKYQDMLAKGNDAEAMKELAKQQATKYATDHFAGKQVALQEAMDKMSKLKSKYQQVASLKELPKRAPNQMKDKLFVERLLPGFAFQIQKGGTLVLDLSPSIGFRFTGRFTAGAAWNERLSFSEWNKVVAHDRIYGPRVFSSFSFKKGFSVKAEIEKMSVYIPAGAVDGSRAWVWSVFTGIKKDYTFHKNIKGNVQVLYNLYDDHDNSPYLDRLNVRMGWEFPLRKRQ